MKNHWLIMVFLVLCSGISFVFAGEVIKFSGSNANTIFNSFEVIPFDPPQFGENITLRANVTDDNDSILWVNFTLYSPTNQSYINNVNGTTFGDFWNSSFFVINESGTWIYNITSIDDNANNETINVWGKSFTITDNAFISRTNISKVVPIDFNLSYEFYLYTDTRQLLNYTINHTLDGNFTVFINVSDILINSTQMIKYIVFNISTNATSQFGNHSGELLLTRTSPTFLQKALGITIEVSSNYGDIEFVNPVDYSFPSCGGSIDQSYPVVNNGNFQLTECHPFLYDANDNEISTSSNFNLNPGANGTAKVNFNYAGTTSVETHFGVRCIGSPNGSIDTTSVDPRITFVPSSECSSSTAPGGGGPSGPKETPAPAPVTNITEIFGLCGNDMCEEGAGETPWNCPNDCLQKVWELDQVFCLPLANCGNWKKAWFTNFLIVMIIASVFFVQFRTKKPKRPI